MIDLGRTDRRFWDKVAIGPGCWNWTASMNFGRGRFNVKEGDNWVPRLAPRVAWELVYGESPGDLCVCHRCDNPLCVRPSHLFLGTHRDNMHDMIAKGRGCFDSNGKKTHCPRGHQYTPENIYPTPHWPGGRGCRECRRIAVREGRARRRATRSQEG